ncbi:TnsA-like heteromeric transposase endonuclease subunit [Acrocarpospora macrocephala]|uniref:TnsA-like heteromeric transposase endonuclease subunit n=1 Tax=Acrocarpospora macrocephala TaxID=150177 RepID=UPI001C3F62FF|nr:TnsA-like heteromeric transposase endonuclease subunit [Acrocarpospora macrocephala]
MRAQDGTNEDGLEWPLVSVERLQAATPWRTFRWHHGQQHFPGFYWSVTMFDLVIYESRLELARLLYADFDLGVAWIKAQPFLLTAQVEGKIRRHVPDFLLFTDAGPVVVDVKPRERLEKEKVAFTLAWAREVVEDRNWRYEVWSEPPTAELANLRLLAGFRRSWLFNPDLLEALISSDLAGRTLREALGAVTGWPQRLTRSHLLHLLWTQVYRVDLTAVLSGDHVLERAR